VHHQGGLARELRRPREVGKLSLLEHILDDEVGDLFGFGDYLPERPDRQ
jgi:hypothetical protein